MTHFSKSEVINNLRAKVQELKGKLEAVRNWHEDVEMDPDDRYRLETILEGETHESAPTANEVKK